ncbi:MAG: HlyC/CorC family transporter [Lachnospiraceae bacterium]|nr:HlyC/CorC family transporter [Lachnospiraceae bacterium]
MDEGQYALCGLIIFVLSLVIQAVFYCFGSAIQEISDEDVDEQAESGDETAGKIKKIMDDPGRFIRCIHLVTAGTDVILGFFVLRHFGLFFGKLFGLAADDYGWYFLIYALLLVVMMIMVLLLGIALPRQDGANHAERNARRYVNFISLMLILLKPVTALVDRATRGLVKVSGNTYQDEEDVTEEEIISMVKEGHEQGILEESEAEMINNIFEFDDKKAEEIMTHRSEIIGLDSSLTLEEAVSVALAESNTRFPVFSGTIDEVLGIMHLKDAMRMAQDEELRKKTIGTIPDLLRELKCVPETKNINDLFREMQQERLALVIVVDEYGQTAGLITMEDILEEIVGNIEDEYDDQDQEIRQLEQDVFLIRGSSALEEVSEALDLDFGEADYDTLNGFMIAKLDRIPRKTERPKIYYRGWVFETLRMNNKMIALVRAVKRPEENESDPGLSKTGERE